MYSVMKNQNGCYVKKSSHAMSSFHVLHLSENVKVPFFFFFKNFFRHRYANSDILVVYWLFYLFKGIKCNIYLKSWGMQTDHSSCH